MARQKNNGSEFQLVTKKVNGIDVIWRCMLSWEAEYSTFTNTSDWTFNVYVSEYGSQYAKDSNDTNPWSYRISTNFCDVSGIGEKLSQPIQPEELDTNGGVINHNWTLVASHVINNVSHDDGYLTSDRLLDIGIIKCYLYCPENSVFDDYSNYTTLFHTISGSDITNMWWASEFDVSEIMASNANIGYNTTISILNDSDKPVHTIAYTFQKKDENNAVDNRTWTQIGSTYRTDREFEWLIPTSFYAEIPNDRQGEIHFKTQTYKAESNGQYSLIGTEYTSITVYAVEEDCNPELAPTIYDSNSITIALTGDNSKLVRHKSHATYNINATTKNYATIVSIEVANGSSYMNTATGTFYGFTNDYFTFQVTDSRGYSTTISYTPDIVPYINLTCFVDAEAPTADGELNFTVYGNYWSGDFGIRSNTLKVFYRIKEINQETGEGTFGAWNEIQFELGTNKYTATVSISDIDYRDTFAIEAYAIDVFGEIYSDIEATSALPIFDWGINDFNMNCDMTVYGTLTVNGNVVATGTIDGQGSGNSSYEIHYGTCQTSGDVSAKLVTCPTFTTLATGSSIRVKFAYANTSANVVMNVNNTGVISVKKNDDEKDLAGAWKKGAVRDFVYDGANWIIVCYD